MNYAIQILEKEKLVLETALKTWSEWAKQEFPLSYQGHLTELKDLDKALKFLKSE